MNFWEAVELIKISERRNFYRLTEKFLSLKHQLWPFPGEKILRQMMQGNRVLIIGSGPSVRDLPRIPKDVKVLTCNNSFQILLDRDLGRKTTDLYLTTKSNLGTSLHRFKNLEKISTDVFMFNDHRFLKSQSWLRGFYKRFVFHSWVDNYYLNKLIHPKKAKPVRGFNFPYLSSGLKLLQYALYFKASEIYLAGIDLGLNRFYPTDVELDGYEKNDSCHLEIDLFFLKQMAKKHAHIYSISAKSPVSEIVSTKELA